MHHKLENLEKLTVTERRADDSTGTSLFVSLKHMFWFLIHAENSATVLYVHCL